MFWILHCLLIWKSQTVTRWSERSHVSTLTSAFSCREARMKPSRDFCPQTTFAASAVTSLSVTVELCEDDNWSHLCRGETLSSSLSLPYLGGFEMADRSQSFIRHRSCVLRESWIPIFVDWGKQFWFSTLVAGPALVCVIDGPSSWPGTDSVDEHWAKYTLRWMTGLTMFLCLAEVSWLHEHLVNASISTFAWRLGFYGEPHRSI
jgi:hypothetical protein